MHDIALRQAVAMGRTSTTQLSNRLALGPSLMTKVVEDLRDLRFLEVQGIDGRDYQLAPTQAGRQQAQDRMQFSRYVGPVPVSLRAYTDVIHSQHANPRVNLAALKAAFSDLVISDELLRELGPAAIAGGAMFLYGPPGHGEVIHHRAAATDLRRLRARPPLRRGRRADHQRVRPRGARARRGAADPHRPALDPVPPPVPHRGRRARPPRCST